MSVYLMAEPHDTSTRSIVALCGILAYQGYAMAINGIGAPFIAASFGLGDAGIARLYAWISPAAFGALLLLRLADRAGRRRVLLACMAATPVAALTAAGAAAARNVVLFAVCDVLLYAFIGAAVFVAVVMLAEALPMEKRARGQSYGGMAMAVGAGFCLMLMPVLASHGLSWRWLLVIAGGGLLGYPLLPRAIPESRRWREAADSGATRAARLLDLFGARYRARAVPIAVCVFLSVMAGTSADAWSYYRAVSSVGLSAATASVLVLTCGGLSLVGFPLGAWACERFGRVPTVVVCWLLAGAGAVSFYWGPPAGFAVPVYWLGASFFWLKTADNAAIVGFRSAGTELFPTALRGTMIGWTALIGAVGVVVAQSSIALLAGPLGGLSRVVAYLALLSLPAAFIFGWFVDETRGLSLEAAGESRTVGR
ncbi:MAG TPA: MFS transporter [Gemmatimonadaceae bacterium]|nr:MFS transporter [Gemmatimonadaceae bacterium]